MIGAGSFARAMHLPNLQKLNDKYRIWGICNRTGTTARHAAEQFGAKYATTDFKEIINDPNIDLVMICTRHNRHGEMILESLRAGKHTFTEKPLCTTQAELESIKEFFGLTAEGNEPSCIGRKPLLMVGFNRRFSRYAREVKKHTDKRINPLLIQYRMNAGYAPLDHWVHGEEGGGRIVGEACHIIDLFSFFVQAKVKSVFTSSLSPKTKSISSTDNRVITLEYDDGSVATLQYFSIGSGEYPKEYMEIHFDEQTIAIDDYKAIAGYGLRVDKIETKTSEKGQSEELIVLHEHLKGIGKGWPIKLEDIIETTEITFNLR